jgi:hypothetical protein
MNDEIPDGAVDGGVDHHAADASFEEAVDAGPQTELDQGAVEETKE